MHTFACYRGSLAKKAERLRGRNARKGRGRGDPSNLTQLTTGGGMVFSTLNNAPSGDAACARG